MNTQKNASLRVCASCEWIFRWEAGKRDCPKCGFATYGARFVFGDKCYRYAKTQEPWMEKKLGEYRYSLMSEVIRAAQDANL